MVGLYDYMDGYLAKPYCFTYRNALKADGSEPADYPLSVYDVADTLIGTAFSKEDFIRLWNSSSVNRAFATITGWYGPFTFELKYLCGTALPAFLGIGGFAPSEADAFLMEDSGFLLEENDDKILL